MKILLTGGAGFIGSALVRHIIRHTDDAVVNVDKLTYAANPAAVGPVETDARYAFEQVDICDGPALARVFRQHQPDAVMHLAAESHVDRSIDGPAAFIQSNTVGTYILLETARAYWAELDPARAGQFRFHHVSTDEVFGDLEDADARPFTEDSPYRPSSPYSASKAASDHLVRAWARTYGLPVLVSHCSNNYGPWQYPEKLIPLVIRLARHRQAIPIYGDGEQIRDWLYVDDHARALHMILRRGRVGATYNVGARQERRNLDVARDICDLLDQILGDHQRQKLITHVADRPGHDRRYALDPGLLESELGWRPTESFESGLRKTVAWYLEHDKDERG